MSALDWSKASLDAEYGPVERVDAPIPIPTVLSRWFLEFRDDLLAGRLDLEELINLVDADHQNEAIELCVECSRRPVRRRGGRHPYRGLCSICWLHRLRDAHLEAIAELEATREVVAAKKEKQRVFDSLYTNRERAHKPFRLCEDCGERLPARPAGSAPVPGDNVCPSCTDLRARRHPERS